MEKPDKLYLMIENSYRLFFDILLLISSTYILSAFIIYIIKKKNKYLLQNILISFLTFIFLITILELYFRFFFAQPAANNLTLSCKNWFRRYWKPINSFGYRDKEWENEYIVNKKKIFVVGDSFTAGAGIKDVKDRFGDVLEEKLGEKYYVFNIAQCGWNTKHEYKAIITNSFSPPDYLLLCYFLNDIEDSIPSKKLLFNKEIFNKKDPGFFKNIKNKLVENSHLINFIYWRIARMYPDLFFPEQYLIYENILGESYYDNQIFQAHMQTIVKLKKWCDINSVNFLIIIFPILSNIKYSQKIISIVSEEIKKNKIPIIDISAILINKKFKDITVNQYDSHPSIYAHKLIAEEIYKKVFQN